MTNMQWRTCNFESNDEFVQPSITFNFLNGRIIKDKFQKTIHRILYNNSIFHYKSPYYFKNKINNIRFLFYHFNYNEK